MQRKTLLLVFVCVHMLAARALSEDEPRYQPPGHLDLDHWVYTGWFGELSTEHATSHGWLQFEGSAGHPMAYAVEFQLVGETTAQARDWAHQYEGFVFRVNYGQVVSGLPEYIFASDERSKGTMDGYPMAYWLDGRWHSFFAPEHTLARRAKHVLLSRDRLPKGDRRTGGVEPSKAL